MRVFLQPRRDKRSTTCRCPNVLRPDILQKATFALLPLESINYQSLYVVSSASTPKKRESAKPRASRFNTVNPVASPRHLATRPVIMASNEPNHNLGPAPRGESPDGGSSLGRAPSVSLQAAATMNAGLNREVSPRKLILKF
jgi:hypothetical protein